MGSAQSRLFYKRKHEQRGLQHPPVLSARPPTADLNPPLGLKWVDGNGLTKAAPSAYVLSHDMEEANRLNQQHYLVNFVFGSNHMTPLQEQLWQGARVLDAGCGTGIWSIEMARVYQASSFTGTDLVEAYSYNKQVPPNCHFLTADTLNLPFADGSFDYVFQRLQTLCFRENEWPRVISELIRVTKPGGWVELVDMDGWLHGGPRTTALYAKVRDVYKIAGINPEIVHVFGETLTMAGLENVEHSHRSVPVGWGPEEIATMSAKNIESAMRAAKKHIARVLGMRNEVYDEMIMHAMEEFTEYQVHWHAFYAFGRKPLETHKV